MTIWITIGAIDMDGFLGRDYHPSRDDAGKTGRLVKMETEDGGGDTPAFGVYTLQMDDGRLLEIIEHEIRAVSSREE